MVSLSQAVFATAVAATAAISSIQALEVGEYFRPVVGEVSGVPGNDFPYRRSPCPALNTLANHGYLPRNGQNISKAVLREAIMGVYNLGDDAAQTLLNLAPEGFSLDFLGTHNAIEHDASLVHTDLHFGQDPAEMNLTLAEDLLARADTNGNLGVKEIAAVRKDRLVNSIATNPTVVFGATQQTLAFTEASIFLLGFGAKNMTVSAEVARLFVVEERIPTGWTRAPTPISVVDVRATVASIIAAAT